jgi:hypothetical protein
MAAKKMPAKKSAPAKKSSSAAQKRLAEQKVEGKSQQNKVTSNQPSVTDTYRLGTLRGRGMVTKPYQFTRGMDKGKPLSNTSIRYVDLANSENFRPAGPSKKKKKK